MKISTFNIIIAILAIFGLSSCNIKEDMSDCPGYILLDYSAYPDEILEDISPDEMVNIYIFDENDICDEIITYSYGELQSRNFQLELPIQYNGRKLVVWHGNNSPDYELSEMEVGECYDEFYLELETLANHSFESVPSSLWASSLQTIKYCAAITRHRIHMMRLHTEVNVHMSMQSYDNSSEFEQLDMRSYVVSITAKDDVYHTDYDISSKMSQMVNYNNMEQVEQATSYVEWAHVGALRLYPTMSTMLYVHDLEGELLYTLDLMRYMLASKEDETLSDRQFLDLEKVWDLELILEEAEPEPDPKPDLGYILVGLRINGWTVWLDTVDLGEKEELM